MNTRKVRNTVCRFGPWCRSVAVCAVYFAVIDFAWALASFSMGTI